MFIAPAYQIHNYLLRCVCEIFAKVRLKLYLPDVAHGDVLLGLVQRTRAVQRPAPITAENCSPPITAHLDTFLGGATRDTGHGVRWPSPKGPLLASPAPPPPPAVLLLPVGRLRLALLFILTTVQVFNDWGPMRGHKKITSYVSHRHREN